MSHLLSRNLAAASLLIAALSTGCSHISVFSRDKVVEADKQNPAAEIVSLWQPAKGPGLNGVPGRGFAGQILFFTRGSGTPAAVDGDVRVYLFDNQGTAEEQGRPIWQFDFPAQDWQNFGSIGTLGPSYNIFIPYVREGQQQVECAIQIRFTPKAGPVVFSEMGQVTLPGRIDAAEGGFLPEKSPQTPGQPPLASRAEPRKLNPDPSSLNVHTIRPTPPGGIVQASHATPAREPARSPEPRATNAVTQADYAEPALVTRDKRIEQLEQYVRELQAEKARDRAPPAIDPALEADETQPQPPSRRLRLTPANAQRPARQAIEFGPPDWQTAE